jgi:hypothetical protein
MDSNTCTFGEKVRAGSSYFPSERNVTDDYEIEQVPLYFEFSNRETTYKDVNGSVITFSLSDVYNNTFWHDQSGKTNHLFQVYNARDFKKHGYIDIEMPKIRNKKTGEETAITSWYYETHLKNYYDEIWSCSGSAEQKSVECTPRENYMATNYTYDSSNIYSFKYKLYFYLENGKYVRVTTKYASFASYFYRSYSYMYPQLYLFGALVPEQ